MEIIGLTGQMGSGKSTVAGILKEAGAYIIDADQISHEVLLKDGPAYTEVVDIFGDGILNMEKQIDRKQLGRIVFKEAHKLEILVNITHKYIKEKMIQELNEAAVKAYPWAVMDAPLLIEACLHTICHHVWVVTAPLELRLNRIIGRDGLTRQEVLSRMKQQMSMEEMVQYATAVIENHYDIQNLQEAVLSLLK